MWSFNSLSYIKIPRVPAVQEIINYDKAQDLEVWNDANNSEYV